MSDAPIEAIPLETEFAEDDSRVRTCERCGNHGRIESVQMMGCSEDLCRSCWAAAVFIGESV